MKKLLNFPPLAAGKASSSAAMWLAILLISTSPVEATLIVGVDLTVEPFDASAICNAITAYVERNTENGEAVFAIAVTGRTLTQPIILSKAQLPEYPGIKSRLKRETLVKFTRDLEEALNGKNQQPKELLKQSHIAEFFALAGSIFDNTNTGFKNRKMLLISDMLEVDQSRNWETGAVLTVRDIKLPAIGGTVAIYGVQSKWYLTSQRWEEVRRAWISLLGDAGVKLLSYASILPQ